ncbi:MAG: hypothetical protein JXB19_00585 [Bacteroidales bacterium]|nr:hypothetical protein [Bacteroidales bacterium]
MKILRSVLCVEAAMLLSVSAFNQTTHDGSTVPAAGVVTYTPSTTEATTHMTEGTTVPVYALPDPYYHPNYDVENAIFTLTNGFTWTWSGTAVDNLTVNQASTDDNYVTVTAASGDAGSYVLSVTENAPALYGGCSGPQVDLNIVVHAEPGVTMGGDATYLFCAGDAGLPDDIQTIISDGWQQYRLVWSLEIATLDELGAKEFYYDDENGTNREGVQKYAEEYTTDTPQSIADAGSAPDLMTFGAFNVINNGTRNAVTVYTYTLTGINDQASRFGDFIDLAGDDSDASAFTYYAAGETVVVTVYPAPVTGPIYHIPNNWAQ